jgi:hypothetical protein
MPQPESFDLEPRAGVPSARTVAYGEAGLTDEMVKEAFMRFSIDVG